MPQFAVLIYTPDSAHAPDASEEDIAECDDHAAEVVDTDAMVAAWALTPRDMAVSIRPEGPADGTFSDGEHIVAGFYILEAPDLAAAVSIAGTNPAIAFGGVEVRPVHTGGMVAD